jgi:hypothetical protein
LALALGVCLSDACLAVNSFSELYQHLSTFSRVEVLECDDMTLEYGLSANKGMLFDAVAPIHRVSAVSVTKRGDENLPCSAYLFFSLFLPLRSLQESERVTVMTQLGRRACILSRQGAKENSD